MYFKSDLEDCYYPLINSSFKNNYFNMDEDEVKSGFSLENLPSYDHPFPEFSNFGFVAVCQSSVDHPYASYQLGECLPYIFLFFVFILEKKGSIASLIYRS